MAATRLAPKSIVGFSVTGALAVAPALGAPRWLWWCALGVFALAVAFTLVSHPRLAKHFPVLARLPLVVNWDKRQPDRREREPVVRSTIPKAHLKELQRVAHTARAYVAAGDFARYASPNEDHLRNAFRRHFGDLAMQLDAHDQLVAELQAKRAARQAKALDLAWANGCDNPYGVASALADATRYPPDSLPFAELTGQLMLCHHPIAVPSDAHEARQIKERYRAMVELLINSPENEAVGDAARAMVLHRGPLIKELQRIEALHVLRDQGGCELC